MAFTDSTKSNYAFKALLGKAHTSTLRELANEVLLSGVTVSGTRVWAERVPTVAATAVSQGIAVLLTGLSLEAVSGAVVSGVQTSYRLKLPGAVPGSLSGKINPLTGVVYASGDYVGGIIPEAFGVTGASDYRPILYGNGVEIPPLDVSDWFLDPFSGTITREGGGDSTVVWSIPLTMDCYVYTGDLVSAVLDTIKDSITGLIGLSGSSGGGGATGIQGATGLSGLTGVQGQAGVSYGITGALEIFFDGAGEVIVPGTKTTIYVPYDINITGWKILGSPTGTMNVQLYKSTISTLPPEISGTISGGWTGIHMTESIYNSDDILLGWSPQLVRDDVLEVNVDSVSSVKNATVALDFFRT
jgi:hypothetical protein